MDEMRTQIRGSGGDDMNGNGRWVRIPVFAVGGLAVLLLFAGCAEEEVPTGVGTTDMVATQDEADVAVVDEVGSPPVIDRLEISPREVMLGREIRVIAEASDPDGGPVRMVFRWLRNGREVTKTHTPSMVFYELEKGDSIRLEAVASDGRHESLVETLRIPVANRPPTLTKLEMEPAGDVRAGMTVTATPYGEDPDNDRLEYEYRWLVDGVEKGTERSFDTTGLRRGSKLGVEVRASDGDARSRPYTIEAELGNTPPTIASEGERPVGGLYQHQFAAKDVDGDRNLRFSLEQGPSGMAIDAITGLLTWTPGEAAAGRHEVVVGVKDSSGDGSTLSFAVNVATQAAEQPPAQPAP